MGPLFLDRGRRTTERLILNINHLPDDDEMHLELLTHWLSTELKELDVEKVEVVKSGRAPEGTRGIPDVPAWGSLLIDVIPGVFPSIVNSVQSWLKRDEGRYVTLEIGGDKLQVTGISSEQQSELIKAWLSRHGTNTSRDA